MPGKAGYLISFLLLLMIGFVVWQSDHGINVARDGDQPQIEIPSVMVNPEPIQPIPLEIKLNAKIVALGELLFYEKRLSASGNTSCATCHSMAKGGADGLDFSVGDDGSIRSRNTLTVLNTGLQHIFNWDGAFTSLKEQALTAINHRMKPDWSEVLPQFKQNPEYRKAFDSLYKKEISPETIADSIATFEMSLITPNSRFDQYLRGTKDAINQEELRGYLLFKQYGCVACHQGVNVGGNMIATLGVMGDYFVDRGDETPADLGRYNVTQREADKHRFKVPSLRNVALTAPYFHDASTDQLEVAVKTMARYQLGRILPDQDIDAIVNFLHTLTGELNGQALWRE